MRCEVCGAEERWLGAHECVQPKGSILTDPDWFVTAWVKHYHKAPQRQHPVAERRTVRVGSVELEVYDSEQEATLPAPPNYRLPQAGKLGEKIQDALRCWQHNRSLYIYGPPGSGKDGFVHYLSSVTKQPGLILQIQPGTSIRQWFGSTQFNQEGSYVEEGVLLRALRDGYTNGSGKRIPYVILLTDFDRADKNQAEALRLIMDSIEGRVVGVDGTTHKVMPGTRIIATANTAGGGDERGRMVSARPIDASILDRFERSLLFPWMEWEDEEHVIRQKFPQITKHPKILNGIGKATISLRKAMQEDSLYGEFSHRALCGWVSAILDLSPEGALAPGVVRRAAEISFVDKMPNRSTRDKALQIIDPFFQGVL